MCCLVFGVSILLRHPEINHMDNICSLGSRPSNKEVVWLDIAVDQVLFVDGLDPRELE